MPQEKIIILVYSTPYRVEFFKLNVSANI